MKKVFFPNLNGIRFIAVFMVIIHHIEQIKSKFNYDNLWENPTIFVVGELGVTLFFVLSGFLITYLLIDEKKESGNISLYGFYLRRILRIWPLYFLVILLAFFVIPKIHFLDIPRYSWLLEQDFYIKLALFAVFLPNVCFLLFPPVSYASQGWSIGVEEQFYLIWPLIIKFGKKVWLPMIIIIAGINALKFMLLSNVIVFSYKFVSNVFLYNFLEKTRIDCMAIGGLGAYLVYNNIEIAKRILYSKIMQISAYTVLILLIYFGVYLKYLHHQVYAVLFCIIIINMACNKDTVISMNNNIFDYLGKISYGLYMYHPLFIVTSLLLCRYIQRTLGVSGLFLQALIYIVSIFLTILVSAVSYRYFEEIFIKKKVKFSCIVSGENAR